MAIGAIRLATLPARAVAFADALGSAGSVADATAAVGADAATVAGWCAQPVFLEVVEDRLDDSMTSFEKLAVLLALRG